MTDRDRVLRTIRALLQKTVTNGCPVEEALAAHAKAQALIDRYQVSHEELYGTGPGPRLRKPEPEAEPEPQPEPAEPKQQQQPAPEKDSGIGVLFPFETAIALGIVLIVAVLWGKSVIAGVSGPFQSSQVVEAPKDTKAPLTKTTITEPVDQSSQVVEASKGNKAPLNLGLPPASSVPSSSPSQAMGSIAPAPQPAQIQPQAQPSAAPPPAVPQTPTAAPQRAADGRRRSLLCHQGPWHGAAERQNRHHRRARR